MKNLSFITYIVAAFIILFNYSADSQTYKIVGTGVTNCYGNSAPITCPTNPSDAFYGQFHGIAPSYQNNGNGTITDNNTGLMWIQARGNKITWDSAFILAAQCNTGGYNDWRVPTIKELYSLINFTGKSGVTRPSCIAYLDTTYFGWTTGNLTLSERIIDAQDYSATQYTSLTMMADTTIFGVNFVDGRIKGYPKYIPPANTVGQKMYVRFVRGNTSYGLNNFVDNGDSTITDNATNLMWTKYDDGNGMNWQSALAYAQTKNAQNYLGHNDWRLPNVKELQSIVDYTRSPDATGSAAIDPVFNCTAITDEGGNTNYPFYWSSTTHLDNMGGVYVAFGEALGYMKMPPTVSYYTLKDVHGAGAQRSDPKAGNPHSYYLGVNQIGDSVFGLGPQGDVIRINNYVRLVRDKGTGSIDKNMNFNLFNVYPNPAKDICLISLNKTYPKVNLKVYNTIGCLVKEMTLFNISQTEISLTNMPEGVYIINIEADNNRFTKKLIKL